MPAAQLEDLLARREALLALAPMQDVTTLVFWRLMSRYSGADVYFTEYFRVSAAATVSYYDITGVNGFDDRRQTALQGFSIDARFPSFCKTNSINVSQDIDSIRRDSELKNAIGLKETFF